jgi:hypothetical protein
MPVTLFCMRSLPRSLFCCSKCKLIYDEGQTFEFGLMKITLTVFLKSDFVLLSARGDAAYVQISAAAGDARGGGK